MYEEANIGCTAVSFRLAWAPPSEVPHAGKGYTHTYFGNEQPTNATIYGIHRLFADAAAAAPSGFAPTKHRTQKRKPCAKTKLKLKLHPTYNNTLPY